MQFLSRILLVLLQWIDGSRRLNGPARLGWYFIEIAGITFFIFLCITGDSPNMLKAVLFSAGIAGIIGTFGFTWILLGAALAAHKIR